jgi:hypothetical protein
MRQIRDAPCRATSVAPDQSAIHITFRSMAGSLPTPRGR